MGFKLEDFKVIELRIYMYQQTYVYVATNWVKNEYCMLIHDMVYKYSRNIIYKDDLIAFNR